MSPEVLARVLGFLEQAPASTAKVSKALGIAQSELNRALSVLGEHAEHGGLGLVQVRDEGARKILSLSDRGRAWLSGHR